MQAKLSKICPTFGTKQHFNPTFPLEGQVWSRQTRLKSAWLATMHVAALISKPHTVFSGMIPVLYFPQLLSLPSEGVIENERKHESFKLLGLSLKKKLLVQKNEKLWKAGVGGWGWGCPMSELLSLCVPFQNIQRVWQLLVELKGIILISKQLVQWSR